MSTMDPELQKQAVKEGIKEWMNEQFATFGKFTAVGLLIAAFGGLVWLALIGAGYHK